MTSVRSYRHRQWSLGTRASWLGLLALGLLACRATRPDAASVRGGPVVGPSPYLPGETPPQLAFVHPSDRAEVRRDTFHGRAWTARVQLQLAVHGGDEVEVFDGAEPLVRLTAAPWSGEVRLQTEGSHVLTAKLRKDGIEVASAARTIVVGALPRERTGCAAELGALGLKFRPAPATKGITDPVVLEPRVGSVVFRGFRAQSPQPILLACRMAIRLHELSQLLESQGVTEVRTMGAYVYRTMHNPNCMRTNDCPLSQHAYGTALDIHELRAGSLAANVRQHWVIDRPSEVCRVAPPDARNALLHRTVCGMFNQRIFNVVLTPNYNARHRDHLHVDLTESWAGIKGDELGIDPPVEGLGD